MAAAAVDPGAIAVQRQSGRRRPQALEQAAAETPDDPDVYLTLGGIALGEGRISDARLNLEKVLLLLGSGHLSAEKTKTVRREALAGLASVAEARGDWKMTQERLNAWLELEPKNGRVRQRLGRALFHLGKTEDAFAALTQAIKDEPALEPAADYDGETSKPEGRSQEGRRMVRLCPEESNRKTPGSGWLMEHGF